MISARPGLVGTIVVAQRSGIPPWRSVSDKLAHTGDDGRDGDIGYAAGDGKDIVTADRHEAVCELR